MSKGHSPRKYNPRKWDEGYERITGFKDNPETISPRDYNADPCREGDCDPPGYGEGYERAFAEWKERGGILPDEDEEWAQRLIDQADMLRAERKERA